MQRKCYIIVVTQARVVCLICTPEARGPAALGLRVYISGRPLVPVLQLLHIHFVIVITVHHVSEFPLDCFSTNCIKSMFKTRIYVIEIISVCNNVDSVNRMCTCTLLQIFKISKYLLEIHYPHASINGESFEFAELNFRGIHSIWILAVILWRYKARSLYTMLLRTKDS